MSASKLQAIANFKGKTGAKANPNGRPPKEWTMTAMYKEAAEEAAETGEPKYKIVARKLLELAQNGDMTAIKELGNRLDGMPRQTLEHEGGLEIKITNADDV